MMNSTHSADLDGLMNLLKERLASGNHGKAQVFTAVPAPVSVPVAEPGFLAKLLPVLLPVVPKVAELAAESLPNLAAAAKSAANASETVALSLDGLLEELTKGTRDLSKAGVDAIRAVSEALVGVGLSLDSFIRAKTSSEAKRAELFFEQSCLAKNQSLLAESQMRRIDREEAETRALTDLRSKVDRMRLEDEERRLAIWANHRGPRPPAPKRQFNTMLKDKLQAVEAKAPEVKPEAPAKAPEVKEAKKQ
jgi:broad specificity phosphatase PhoE